MHTLAITTPSEILATGGDTDADISQYSREGVFVLSVKNTAGTNPTLTTKLQHSEPLSQGTAYTTVGTNDIPLRYNTNDNIKLSASFTQSGARQIKTVALKLKKVGTITTGKVVFVTIETNNAGDPSGTALGTSANVQTDDISSSAYAWVTFTFAKPVDVSDATVYHVVLAGDFTVSTSNHIVWRTATVASGGNANVYDSGWAAVSTNSREFFAYEYNFSDVTSGGFTQVTTALTGSLQFKEFDVNALKPIVRPYHTIGGTSNPAFQVGVAGVFLKIVNG